MKILFVTDNISNQINGVNTTLNNNVKYFKDFQVDYKIITPEHFAHFPIPIYPEVKCALASNIKNILTKEYDSVHIQTEGLLGLAFRNYCVDNKIDFTTSYLTKLPEMMGEITGMPQMATLTYVKWFHRPSKAIMVCTDAMKQHLLQNKFKNNIVIWSKGVDTELYRPRERNNKVPILLYVGRVSFEKGIEDFLNCPINYKKIIVGDGPIRNKLEEKYPEVEFKGYLFGEELSKIYSMADVFVFPSKNDTFGLVLLESLACGTPIAAYPTTGPNEIVDSPNLGCLSENLSYAIEQALTNGKREECRNKALKYSWKESAKSFINNLVPAWRD